MKDKFRLGLLALALISSPSFAGFEVVKGQLPSSAGTTKPVDLSGFELVADRRVLPLMQTGTPNPEVQMLSAGYSDGIPMETALKALLPQGWSGYIRPTINKSAVVRWTNGSTWLQALEQMGRQLSVASSIDWRRQIVTVEPMPVESLLDARGGGLLVPHAVDAASMPIYNASGSTAFAPLMAEGVPPANGGRPFGPQAIGNTQIQNALPPELGQDMGLGNPNIDTLNPAYMTTKYRDYATMQDFLNEEIQVDIRGASLRAALERILPPGWDIDIPDRTPAIDNIRVDVTHVASRGSILHGLLKGLDLTLFPYPEMRKAVVAAPTVKK